MKIPNKNTVEAVLVELCAATTDLANSANIAVSRMALRSKLAAAIVDAGKAERAAEALRTAAACSAKITELEKTTLMPAMRAGLIVQQDH